MSMDLISLALLRGAKLYASISGGKDGQAMVASLVNNQLPITGLIHADLGRVEWPESFRQCQTLAAEHAIPLHIVKRSDGLGLLEIWKRRMAKLQGKQKPFWSSSKQRYCTSDLKIGPINVFFTATGHDFIISAEGLRADESKARSQKNPLSIRSNKSSAYYAEMTVEEAIFHFRPGKKLVLTWYPIFNFSNADVWATYHMSEVQLIVARSQYAASGILPAWWPFHPAYVFGNQRVSCRYCILGRQGDLRTAARHDHDQLLDELIDMERVSGYTFKNNFSLRTLRHPSPNTHLTGIQQTLPFEFLDELPIASCSH